jgi:hypothetical protein
MIIIFVRCSLFAQSTRVTDGRADGHWCNNRQIEYTFSVLRWAGKGTLIL